MPTTYQKAPQEIMNLVRKVITDHRPDLAEAGVKVDVLLVRKCTDGGSPILPSLTAHGYAALATIKRLSLRERVGGLGDALIQIDGYAWHELDELGQLAVIDHQLMHLEVLRDKGGAVALDDASRPKLAMRLHDWQLGGFTAVAQRHGASAVEVQAFNQAVDRYGQHLMPWAVAAMGAREVEEVGESAAGDATTAKRSQKKPGKGKTAKKKRAPKRKQKTHAGNGKKTTTLGAWQQRMGA